jgi:pimeloyl-ACP methyl ester carboxylesterase
LKVTEDVATPRERFIELRGLRFHYMEWGDPTAPPLVLMHGGGSSARGTWTPTAPAFASRFHIVAPDHRGHGESDWDADARYGVGEYAADFDAFVRALELPPFFVVAHSMGGFITLTYAAEHAAAIKGLVLVDSAPHFEPITGRVNPWASRPLRFDSRADAEAYARARMPEAARGRSLGYGFIDLPDGKVTWRTDIAGLTRARQRIEEEEPGASLLPVDLLPVYVNAPFPILVLRAGATAWITPEHVERLRTANPRASIITYENAHHWLHQDEPTRFEKDVLAFFDKNSAPRAS